MSDLNEFDQDVKKYVSGLEIKTGNNEFHDEIDESINLKRINQVERFFKLKNNHLAIPGRILVGEGILMRMSRKKLVRRHFFLFNDILIYGSIISERKLLTRLVEIPLNTTEVKSIDDNGVYKHGFTVLNPKKSFTVYAQSEKEKLNWVSHLTKCILDLKSQETAIAAPVWVPDNEATRCMLCQIVEFSALKRRHHCRACGKVVCDKCSNHRWLMPNQGNQKKRVCEPCFNQFSANSSHTDTSSQNNDSTNYQTSGSSSDEEP